MADALALGGDEGRVIKQYFFILLKVAVFIPYNPVVLFAKLEFHIA